MFSKFSGTAPVINRLDVAGDENIRLAQFSNIQEATDALILINNRYNIKPLKEVCLDKHYDILRNAGSSVLKAAFYDAQKRNIPEKPVEDEVIETDPVQITVFSNRSWLSDLKKNFHQEIVLKCSSRTREAVEKNEDVQVENWFSII